MMQGPPSSRAPCRKISGPAPSKRFPFRQSPCFLFPEKDKAGRGSSGVEQFGRSRVCHPRAAKKDGAGPPPPKSSAEDENSAVPAAVLENNASGTPAYPTFLKREKLDGRNPSQEKHPDSIVL